VRVCVCVCVFECVCLCMQEKEKEKEGLCVGVGSVYACVRVCLGKVLYVRLCVNELRARVCVKTVCVILFVNLPQPRRQGIGK